MSADLEAVAGLLVSTVVRLQCELVLSLNSFHDMLLFQTLLEATTCKTRMSKGYFTK